MGPMKAPAQTSMFGKMQTPANTLGPVSNKQLPRPTGPVIGPPKQRLSGFKSLFGNNMRPAQSPLQASASNARMAGQAGVQHLT